MFADKNAVRSIDVASGDAVIEAKVGGDGAPVVMLAGHALGGRLARYFATCHPA
jgi:hypothetical protein